MRARLVTLPVALAAALAAAAAGQAPAPARRLGPSLQHDAVHYGKWLTAGAVVAFTVMAAHEHGYSRRDWNDLLVICRSADDACASGSDGRYVNSSAEFLYQRSLHYDRRANRRLLGAQGSLLVTAALFILDLRGRKDEPDNIPFRPLKVAVEPGRVGAALVGLRWTF
jgi:hypothetical protein